MRRFDVYFLQKRDATGWETLERAQSASVLVSSMVREFDGEADAELRVVGGDWNAAIGEWEFSQIFFVDRGAIDLSLAETAGDLDDAEPERGANDDTGIWGDIERDIPQEEDTPPDRGGFADAIHAAQEEAVRTPGDTADDHLEDRLTASAEPASLRDEADRPASTVDDDDDVTNEDLRSLGFTRHAQPLEEPVGPPPDFRPEPRSRGRAFFMVGTVLISLVLIVGAAAALMVFFKVDPAPRYIEMLRDWKESALGEEHAAPMAAADMVMPQTAGDIERYAGIAPDLQGHWSSGDCAEEYIAFENDGYVVKSRGRDPSVKVPVVETLEDEYTWYLRRHEALVQHFQKLGADDIQMIGDTTSVGFTQRTSEVFTRCSV